MTSCLTKHAKPARRAQRIHQYHNENMCRDWHVVDAVEEDHYYGCLEMECWRCYYALLLTATSIAHRNTAVPSAQLRPGR